MKTEVVLLTIEIGRTKLSRRIVVPVDEQGRYGLLPEQVAELLIYSDVLPHPSMQVRMMPVVA